MLKIMQKENNKELDRCIADFDTLHYCIASEKKWALEKALLALEKLKKLEEWLDKEEPNIKYHNIVLKGTTFHVCECCDKKITQFDIIYKLLKEKSKIIEEMRGKIK